jgi:hypothetical protein
MTELVEFLNMYRAPAQHLVALLLAGAMWRWGGAPERLLSGAFLVTMVVSVYVLGWLFPLRTLDDPTLKYRLMVDVAAAAAFIAIALRANRNYPLWIAGFQLVALGAYLVKSVAPDVSQLALVILIVGPSYCQLLLLFGGFVRHLRRERRFGPYRDWRVTPPAIGGLTA